MLRPWGMRFKSSICKRRIISLAEERETQNWSPSPRNGTNICCGCQPVSEAHVRTVACCVYWYAKQPLEGTSGASQYRHGVMALKANTNTFFFLFQIMFPCTNAPAMFASTGLLISGEPVKWPDSLEFLKYVREHGLTQLLNNIKRGMQPTAFIIAFHLGSFSHQDHYIVNCVSLAKLLHTLIASHS